LDLVEKEPNLMNLNLFLVSTGELQISRLFVLKGHSCPFAIFMKICSLIMSTHKKLLVCDPVLIVFVYGMVCG
jgi:hypothetical protein